MTNSRVGLTRNPTLKVLLWGIVVTVLLAVIWWSTRPQIAASDHVVRIGYQKISLYRHLFVGDAEGLFTKEGVKVQLVPFTSGNQMMNALLAGDIDVAGLTNMEVALRVEGKSANEFEFVNFQVWTDKAFPDYLLDCTANRSIDSVAKLNGRRLGRHPGSAVEAFANELLELNRVDPANVRQLEIEPKLMRDAVAAKQVDALYAMDPAATKLVRSGACGVMVSHPLGRLTEAPIPISGTAFSRKFLKEHPLQAQATIRAFDAAIDFLRNPANDQRSAETVTRYTEIDQPTAIALNPSLYWKNSEIDPKAVSRLITDFRRIGVSKDPIEATNFILSSDMVDRLDD